MARADDAGRDITEGDGVTALTVAWSRVQEQDSDCPLFTDPYAKLFVDAAAERGWRVPVAETAARLRAACGYAASRTKWFDEFFIAAGANGIDQAVILAAGLDARAWRLPWVGGSAVYEIDQPTVLAFKAETLRRHAATPGAHYVAVPIALHDNWPEALRRSGFDPDEPTAWAAEDLLPTLSAEDQSVLFERIGDLSAPGSRIAVEASEVTDWFLRRGWEVTAIAAADLMDRYGRCAAGEADDTTPRTLFAEGRLLT
ncbi:SAM-dependent methyltransferase [Mycobacterium sp. IDR2000157661]|uniref:SAM-dependent methyltransferase n=1 Tax=Mycobacterium sp. IDR2000157661 TaxID=2867005 RepID=UPI001EEB7173|nr:SAM-dependent methyltransferase [Mycobacterium sp. IDR2000157661]ULE34264.1 SAM-dependent methyltransferase [Mycobacterium sp. IDR2000157661]